MFRLSKPVVDLCGYSRRERRASLMLLILIAILIILRLVVPEKRISIEDISSSIIPVDDQEAEIAVVHKERKSGDGAGKGESVTMTSGSVQFSTQKKKMELNTCDSADLERLPGIGPVLSARIIKYRNLLGGYAYVSQLREVYGLRDSTYNLIYKRLSADSALVRKIKINSASYNELNRHPYLERYDVQAILKYRQLNVRISSITELIKNNILTEDKARKIFPYLKFD